MFKSYKYFSQYLSGELIIRLKHRFPVPRPGRSRRQDGSRDQGAHKEHGAVEEHREGAERRHQPRHQGAGENDQQAGHAAQEEGGVHEEDQRTGLPASGSL